jgi:hypothetical protein
MRGRVPQFRRFYAILGSAIYLQQSRHGGALILLDTCEDFQFAVIADGFDPRPNWLQKLWRR